jgi:hypothetical protein
MTKVQKITEACDRCAFGAEKQATTKRCFSVDNVGYKLKLCEQHATGFDRDFMGWIRLAAEDESFIGGLRGFTRSSQYFTESEREDQRRVAILRNEQQRQDEEVRQVHDAELARQKAEDEWSDKVTQIKATQIARGNSLALKWVITEHARVRMAERDYLIEDVLQAAEHPEETFPGDVLRHGLDSRVHRVGEHNVVVIPNRKVIVTVLPKNARLFRPKDLSTNPHLERIAQ